MKIKFVLHLSQKRQSCRHHGCSTNNYKEAYKHLTGMETQTSFLEEIHPVPKTP
jgi:hypothetical protein